MADADRWALRYHAVADALRGLKRGGDCWCEVAIGNPMYSRHTEACDKARAALSGVEHLTAHLYEHMEAEVDAGRAVRVIRDGQTLYRFVDDVVVKDRP
jgi:hypothetical protein